MTMIKLLIANEAGSSVIEIEPSEYVVIDLRNYDEDKSVESVQVSTEGKSLTATPGDDSPPQKEKLFDDTQYVKHAKKPWEFV